MQQRIAKLRASCTGCVAPQQPLPHAHQRGPRHARRLGTTYVNAARMMHAAWAVQRGHREGSPTGRGCPANTWPPIAVAATHTCTPPPSGNQTHLASGFIGARTAFSVCLQHQVGVGLVRVLPCTNLILRHSTCTPTRTKGGGGRPGRCRQTHTRTRAHPTPITAPRSTFPPSTWLPRACGFRKTCPRGPPPRPGIAKPLAATHRCSALVLGETGGRGYPR